MSGKSKRYFAVGMILTLSVIISLTVNREITRPKLRKLHFKAKQYSYDPHRVVVNRGDTLQISLESEDVTHGFYLEGYDFDAYVRAQFPYFWLKKNPGDTESVPEHAGHMHDEESDDEYVEDEDWDDDDEDWDDEEEEEEESDYITVTDYKIVTNRTGKFRYRCSVTCGTMHPFMQGELIVKPNNEYALGIGLSLGIFVSMLVGFAPGRKRTHVADNSETTERKNGE